MRSAPSGNQLYPAADGGVRSDATVVRPPRPERTGKVSLTLSACSIVPVAVLARSRRDPAAGWCGAIERAARPR